MTETVVFDGSGALIAAANPAYSTGRLIAAFVRDETERWREERELKRRVAELDAKGAS